MEVGRKASGAVGCFTPRRTPRPSIAVGITLQPSIAVGRCITLRPSIMNDMIAVGRHRTLRPSMAMGSHENPALLLAGSTLDLCQVRRQSVTVDRKDARKDPPVKNNQLQI